MKARVVILALVVVLMFGVVSWVKGRPRPPRPRVSEKSEQLVVITTAKRQDLLITITQTGVVAAKNATPVIPEISGRIQSVCTNGTVVRAGDPIVSLDPTNMQEQLIDLTVRYEEAKRSQAEAATVGTARMKEMRLRLRRARNEVSAFSRQQEIALRQTEEEIAFETKELEHMREDLEVKKRMAAKGLVAGTEVERGAVSLKAAEFSLQRRRSNHELQKSKAESDTLGRRSNVTYTSRSMTRTSSWSERSVRMSGNTVENLQLKLARAQEDLEKTILIAPVGGLVVINSQGGGMRGNSSLPRQGDWVSQGREVAQIVDIEHLQVDVELGQAEITGVKMGQAAEVAIEALPGKTLKGKVTAIGQTARRPPIQGWMGVSSTTSFPVTIDLPPIGKTLVRPGMRANIRIVPRRVKDAITVPSGCIFQHADRPVVYVKRNGEFARVAVTLGESNGDYTVIVKGLKEGEQVALNDLGAHFTGSEEETKAAKERPE